MMLTAKQQRFVDEFSLDHNASRAARAAGYGAISAKVTASRLLTNANVRAAVTVREMEAEKALEMTKGRVLKALQDAFEIAKQQCDPAAMIAACRAIASMCGYYYAPERKVIDVSTAEHGFSARMEAMTDAELIQILQADLIELPS